MKKLLLTTLVLAVLMLSSCQKQDLIGKDKAREIALKHANLTAEQVKFIETDIDLDNGGKVYEIEFYTNDFTEYDYEIDATNGDILSFDSDAEGFSRTTDAQNTSQTDSAGITEAEAKKMVLEKVPGATEENIRSFKTDYDDGKEQFEGKILFENMEYEFEIDIKTGKITSWESESVFD